MKTLKQIESDPRIYEIERNPDWSPELAEDYPEWHPSKYIMVLADGYIFDDLSSLAGADTVKELNELLNQIEEDTGVR